MTTSCRPRMTIRVPAPRAGLLSLAVSCLWTVAPLSAQWKVTVIRDPITDEVTTAFGTSSTNTIRNSIGVPVRAQLILRCGQGEFADIFVVTGGYVGEEVKVQYRFDGGTPFEEEWAGGRAKDALFYPSPSSALAWLTAVAILGSKQMVFRWFPPMADAKTVIFSVAGFDALPQTSLRACGRDRATLAIRDGEREKQRLVEAKKIAVIAAHQSDDKTLPWAGKRDGTLYWKNASGCWHHKVSSDRSEWIYFRQEEDAVALSRTRSTEQGC